MGKIVMHTIEQLCPACGKKHTFEIEESNGLEIITSCPNTGKKLKATVEVIARTKNRFERIAENKKFWFWFSIVFTGLSALVGCADFILGGWELGIVMILCVLLNYNTARVNSDY